MFQHRTFLRVHTAKVIGLLLLRRIKVPCRCSASCPRAVATDGQTIERDRPADRPTPTPSVESCSNIGRELFTWRRRRRRRPLRRGRKRKRRRKEGRKEGRKEEEYRVQNSSSRSRDKELTQRGVTDESWKEKNYGIHSTKLLIKTTTSAAFRKQSCRSTP